MLKEDAHFAAMFGSLTDDLARLCLTQDQILRVVEKNRGALQKHGSTFLLFASYDEFFVCQIVMKGNGSLAARVNRLGNARIWDAESGNRVIVLKSV